MALDVMMSPGLLQSQNVIGERRKRESDGYSVSNSAKKFKVSLCVQVCVCMHG